MTSCNLKSHVMQQAQFCKKCAVTKLKKVGRIKVILKEYDAAVLLLLHHVEPSERLT
jgi:hypothetical protein